MPQSILKTSSAPAPLRFGTQVLRDYEHWLQSNYGSTATYLPHAKSFLVRYKSGGSLSTQLDTFARSKSATGRSLLSRFATFLEEKKIDVLQNDFLEERLPKSGILVKLFLLSIKDRLKSKTSRATYANILNGYLKYVGDVSHIEKFTAERYIFSKKKSDFTSRLYASVIRQFTQWVLSYIQAPQEELTPLELQIKYAFSESRINSLKQILTIRARSPESKTYHKDSLSRKERDRMLKACTDVKERAILSLMAWNGLRPIEVIRLGIKDIRLDERTITIWGKGRSARNKQVIPIFKVPRKDLRFYLKSVKLKSGKLFPKLNYKVLHELVMKHLNEIGVTKKRGPFSPHSLRHTAGQLLYDQGIRLEFVQKTLRHTNMESTLVYAQKAIDRAYFRKMKRL